MSRHVLVTGGLGFLGASLTRALVARGERVRVLDNGTRGSRQKLGDIVQDVEIIEGDIRDPVVVKRAVHGVDTVCHLAYVNGTQYFYERPALVLDVAVKGMVNVVDACISEGIGDLLLVSSSEVYQTPPSVPTNESVPLSVPDVMNPRYSYGGGKIIAELMAINYGRTHLDRVVIVRPHNVYGPAMGWEHVIPQFASRMVALSKEGTETVHSFPIQGDGTQRRSFIFIEDFTASLLAVLEKGEHLSIYHLGTEEEHAISHVAELIAKECGISIALKPGPPAPGGTERRCPDTTKLRSLGFAPSISLADGIARTVPWYREHPAPDRKDASAAFSLFLPST